MANSLRDFARRMVWRGAQIPQGSAALVRKAALAADQAIVMGTPVDTGRARSNWIASTGMPAAGAIDAYAPGELSSTEAANTQAALDQGEAVIKGYRGEQDVGVFITNNLPYIEKLNEGHSPQAPPGFVQQGILDALEAVRAGSVLDGAD